MKIVDDREKFSEHIFVRKLHLLALISLRQPFVVLKLGSLSQIFIVKILNFVHFAANASSRSLPSGELMPAPESDESVPSKSLIECLFSFF